MNIAMLIAEVSSETVIMGGVGAFLAIIMALVAVLVGARSKLVNTADVKIGVNHDPELAMTVPAGSTLLNTLGRPEDFHSLRVRWNGLLRRLQGPRPRRWRRHAAYGRGLDQPR